MSNAHDLLEQGVYSAELFAARSDSLSVRIEKEKEKIETISEQIAKQPLRYDKTKLPKKAGALCLYQNLKSAKDKNDILRLFVSRVEYRKSGQKPKAADLIQTLSFLCTKACAGKITYITYVRIHTAHRFAVAPETRSGVLSYAVTVIPRQKILMGMPNYGYDWTSPFRRGSGKNAVKSGRGKPCRKERVEIRLTIPQKRVFLL